MPGRRRRSRVLLASGVALAVVLGVAAWLGFSWFQTYQQARGLEASVTQLRASLSAKQWSSVTDQVPPALASAQGLRSSTEGLPWRILERVPVLGVNATAVSVLADASASLLEAAQPLTPFAQRIVRGDVRGADGSVDLAILAQVAPLLQHLSTAIDEQVASLGGVDMAALRPELGDPLAQLRDELASAAPSVATAAQLSGRLPRLLGAEGERRWLVLLQNPAEARGSGGYPGGFVTVAAVDGRLSLLESGKNQDLWTASIPIEAAPADAQLLWGGLLSQWNTFNVTPDFPTVAQLAAAGMKARGEPVDGVIAIDPETVAAMLAVAGPVTAGGQTVTADNAVRFFTVDEYTLIPDQAQRDATNIALINDLVGAFFTSDWDPLVLIDALRAPVADNRIHVWSADPAEEEWLLTTGVGGSLPDTPGPVLAVALNNSSGNKLDAFVASTVDYQPGQCLTASMQRSTAAITLENRAPEGLAEKSNEYGRLDDPTAPAGSTRMLVHVYAPVGATYVSSALDGKPIDLYVGEERQRPVWWTFVTLERGQSSTLDVTFDEPSVPGVEPSVLKQGMVIPQRITIRPNTSC